MLSIRLFEPHWKPGFLGPLCGGMEWGECDGISFQTSQSSPTSIPPAPWGGGYTAWPLSRPWGECPLSVIAYFRWKTWSFCCLIIYKMLGKNVFQKNELLTRIGVSLWKIMQLFLEIDVVFLLPDDFFLLYTESLKKKLFPEKHTDQSGMRKVVKFTPCKSKTVKIIVPWSWWV